MNRRTAAFLILAVWIGVFGWYALRQQIRPASDLLSDAAFRVSPGATYFALNLGGEQIGFASSSIDTLLDSIVVRDQMVLEIPALGTIQRVDARTEANLSRSLQLLGFQALMRGDGIRFGASGDLSSDTLLSVDIETAENRDTIDIPLDEPIILPVLLPVHLVFGSEPAVGNEYQIKMFDPLLLQNKTIDVTVLTESTLLVPDSAAFDSSSSLWVPARWDTLQAWRIAQHESGITVESWIDELGQMIETTSPVGFTIRRTAFEVASLNFQRREVNADLIANTLGANIVRQTVVAAGIPLETGMLEELRVSVAGFDLTALELSGGRQTLDGDTLHVQRETEEMLGFDPERFTAETSQQLAEFLRAEPLIQSRDARILAQARQITEGHTRGRRRNYTRAAQLLNQWIFENIEKSITVSVPSAIGVLEARTGDCNDHTVLYVAMARAVGIPARSVTGLVYTNGKFYYHAWPEVYLNGWVAVDPTFGQFPADAAHIRFAVGGLARQIEMARLIGSLQLEILPSEN